MIQSSLYFFSLFICGSIFFISSIQVSAELSADACSVFYNEYSAEEYQNDKYEHDVSIRANLFNDCNKMAQCSSWPTDHKCNCRSILGSNYGGSPTDTVGECVNKAKQNLQEHTSRQLNAENGAIQQKKVKETNKPDDTTDDKSSNIEDAQKGKLISTCEKISSHCGGISKCKGIDIKNISNIPFWNNNDYLKEIYKFIKLDICKNTTKESLKEKFIPICTAHLSNIISQDKKLLFCPSPSKESDKDNNEEHCETYCTEQFDDFYMSKYSMEGQLDGYSEEQFVTDYLKDFPKLESETFSVCYGNPNKSECGSFSIAYLALVRGEGWATTNIVGRRPTKQYQAPLEGNTAMGKWLNKKLFGSTDPEGDTLTAEAREKGFYWEKCDVSEKGTECQKEMRAALERAGGVCTKEVEKVVSCCASPITCASGETSVPSLTSAMGLIYALQDVATQIHVTTGPIGDDVYEYQREVCQRMKQANIGRAGISGAMAAMCKAASASCNSSCKDATHEAFNVLDKHCGYKDGKQRMESLKKGQRIEFDKLFNCTQDFFSRYSKDYVAIRQSTAECSKASAVGVAHIQQLGTNAAQALMLEQAGCGVRPKDPECTGNQLQDKLNKRNDCKPNCEKYPYQEVCGCDEPPYRSSCTACDKNPDQPDCPGFCNNNPQHEECQIDCSLSKNKNHRECVETGGGGVDCTESANKDHPECQEDLTRREGEFFEDEELDDLLKSDPQGKGNPPPGGLIAGASGGGGGGLRGLGNFGGGPSGKGKKRRGKRKIQSILQGFKGRGQFGGYGFGSGGGGGDPETEGKGKKAKNKMGVDLGKYFKKKGRLGSGAHKSIFQRISKRFQWMCKQRKIRCI